MKRLLLSTLLIAAGASAQDAAAPVSPQQFLKTEGVQTTYTVQNGDLNPADALNLMLQCAPPISAPYDSDRDGRNDTLRVYGFAIVSAQVYQVRGVTAMAPAIQKAQLRANGAAAEFFGGLRTAVERGLDSRNTTASVVDGGDLKLSDLAVETVRDTVSTNAQALLRGGRITGHRIVSLGNQGLCVVARYELPLDQRAAASAGSEPPAGQPGLARPVGSGGFTPPPPGTTGDF
ncbi:hypothetical protein GCM10008956_36920 [Deinococcus arenae]|uniref:FlgO domain-containing protein n=1 Tax=Deinococcus arenae TaxID=1452751 RepID=A0A8H9GVK9_9DEIO|nr:hypothetical protein [Deinococcus arenae]GGM57919.1 hypothetical protein GCM10008956_36920 [Deinococcus arenae]